MIAFEDIHLTLKGRPVLRGFTLQPNRSQLSLLAGPNGAGKSSALKVAAGLWKADSGALRMDGVALSSGLRRARQIAYLPQAPGFHPRLRTEGILRFYARLEGRGRAAARAALERFGLDEHARHASGDLSGGLRQRLGLAVLSLSSAPVWLLDEPGLSLDPFWRRRLQAWLRHTCGTDGRTVLVATHLLGEWEGRADACYLCEAGRIAGEERPDDLRDSLLRVRRANGGVEDASAVGSVEPERGGQ